MFPAVVHIESNRFPPVTVDVPGIQDGLLVLIGKRTDHRFGFRSHIDECIPFRIDFIEIFLQTDVLIRQV